MRCEIPSFNLVSVIRATLLALSLGVFATFASAQTDQERGSAVGEPTRVMIVDQDLVVDRSTALADLRPRVARLTKSWEDNLNAARLRLKEQNDLAELTFPEGSVELGREKELIQAELEVLGQEVDARKRRLNEINVSAIRLVRRQVVLFAQQVAQERGANMVISKSSGIWVPVTFDLTEDVLARLNAEYTQIVPLVAEIEAEIVQTAQ